MEVGFLHDGAFQPLASGDACLIIDAPQGGFWSMPTVRVWGMDPDTALGCALFDIDLDQELGRIDPWPGLRPSRDGGNWLEAAPFLLPMEALADKESFDAAHGHSGVLTCTAVSDDVELSLELDVVIDTMSGFI